MKRSMGQWRGGLRGSACQLEHAKRRELVGPGGGTQANTFNDLLERLDIFSLHRIQRLSTGCV